MDNVLSEYLSLENLRYVLQLTVLIGGYILLRPLIEIGFRRLFATRPQQPKVARQKSLAEEVVVEDTDEEPEEDGIAASGEWGSGMRRRQSKFVEYWEAEQARRLEEEDLEDIKDLLQD